MKKILSLLVVFISISLFSSGAIISKETFDSMLKKRIVVFEGLRCYVNMDFWNALDVTQKKKFCIDVSDTHKYFKQEALYKFYSLKDESIIAKKVSSSGYEILK